jgi:membrane fusion protein (multidrug efflux system)
MKKGISLLAIAVALAGTAYFSLHNDAAAVAASLTTPPPFEVKAMSVIRADVTSTKEYPGRVTAYKVSEVRPQVSGVIVKRLFEEGSDVTEGQQLYQIDPAPYIAALNSAKADLQKAKATNRAIKLKADRYKDLLSMDAVSKQEYDDVVASQGEAVADIAIAQAAVDTAQINVNYTKVYAPISGRVGISTVTEGALVTANQTSQLTTITQLDPVYVDMTGSEDDLTQLRPASAGQPGRVVHLTVGSGNAAYAQDGEMKFSDVTVNETTGTVQLRAVFPNPDHTLLPGQFVKAKIDGEVRQELLVPQSAAIRGSDTKLSVWRIDQDYKVSLQPINATESSGNQWIVTDGLKEGDMIVTEGFQKIKAGDIVKIAPTAEAANADSK